MSQHKALIHGFSWREDMRPLFPRWADALGGGLRHSLEEIALSGAADVPALLLTAFLEGREHGLAAALAHPRGRDLLARRWGAAFPGRVRIWLDREAGPVLEGLELLAQDLAGQPLQDYVGLWHAILSGEREPALCRCRQLEQNGEDRLPTGLNARSAFLQALLLDEPLPGPAPSGSARLATRLKTAGDTAPDWTPDRGLVDSHRYGAMVGKGQAFLALLEQLESAASSPLPVLLLGETGSGKELAVRFLHERSATAGELVPINCAALPEDLAEAELFGSAHGAFTGAADRSGLVEQAAGGLLFLDEFGSLAPRIQAKLLRFLEDGSFRRVGEARPRHVACRIVCATCELGELRAGRIRSDLLHRVSGLCVHVPPLRERREDLPLLVRHFLIEAGARRVGRHPLLEAAALRRLRRHDWPGNLRELKHFVQASLHVAVTDLDDRLDGLASLSKRFPDPLRSLSRVAEATAGSSGELSASGPVRPLREALRQTQQQVILQALQVTGQNKREAAALLQISLPSLYAKLKECGIAPARAGRSSCRENAACHG